MTTSPHPAPVVQPAVLGALLLLALRHLRELSLPLPTAAQVLAAVGASKSRAHELIPRVEAMLVDVVRPSGRPPTPAAPAASTADLTREVLDWLMRNPGAVHTGPRRNCYQASFRRKILELRERCHEPSLDDFAAAVRVPVETLRDWLRVERPEPEPEPKPAPKSQSRIAAIELARIQALLAAWRDWRGHFQPFCQHVREHLGLSLGDTLIGNILDMCGVRRRERRAGRSPDEQALRRRFETFFAGAQWTGDGSPLAVWVDDERFLFNLELMVDTHTAALVGASIRDAEDARAVVEAFEDGVQTTGAAPLAVLLDNRSGNHTEEVRDALGDASLIHATVGRPQNKGHVEGAFGLFAQIAPSLSISTDDPKATAKSLLHLAFLIWARTLNHRPRSDGKSRVDRYRDERPDPETVERARQALQERLARQEAARRTREARENPIVRALIDGAFARLQLEDPHGNARAAIARYPIDFVIEGVAIFDGKRAAGTLPEGAGAAYLLGIVRNLAAQDEGLATADALWRLRREAGDQFLRQLEARRDALAAQHLDSRALLSHLVDEAVGAEALIDRRFWLHAIAALIESERDHRPLYELAARRAHASWRVPQGRRETFVRHLSRLLVCLE